MSRRVLSVQRSASTLTLFTLGLLLTACVPGQSEASKVTAKPAAIPAPTTRPAPVTPPAVVYAPLAQLSATPVRTFEKAGQVVQAGKSYRAVLTTSKGDITLDLNAKESPVAVNNFVFLALNRFYDGTRFHRVIDGFMAQGGDPLSADATKQTAWGTGGPGYNFAYEVTNGLRFNAAGVLGMARAASPNSQGSQFFITVAPADFLSGQYTVFGRVVAGMDVLARLTRTSASSPTGDRPIPGAQADVLLGVKILVSQ